MSETSVLREVDLLKVLVAVDADGTVISGKDSAPIIAKDLITRVLLSVHEEDAKERLQEKQDRNNLVRRISKADKITLTQQEVKLICERAGKILVQVSLLGELCDALGQA